MVDPFRVRYENMLIVAFGKEKLMPDWLLLVRYEPEVMRQIVQDPAHLAARDNHAFSFYGAVGGKVKQWWLMRSERFDFAVLVEFPDAEAAHAATMVGWSSGAFRDGEVFALANPEELEGTFHKAAAAAAAFYAPMEGGESSPLEA